MPKLKEHVVRLRKPPAPAAQPAPLTEHAAPPRGATAPTDAVLANGGGSGAAEETASSGGLAIERADQPAMAAAPPAAEFAAESAAAEIAAGAVMNLD